MVGREAKVVNSIKSKMTMKDWYNVCQTYDNLKVKVSQAQFLKSNQSGEILTGTQSQKVSFSNKLKNRLRSSSLII